MHKPIEYRVIKDSKLKFPHIFVIHASAGSGKTYNLANRYVQFILSNKIPDNDISNILAITFTDNAAKEMKTRIIKTLKRIALSDAEVLDMMENYLDVKSDEIVKMAEEKVSRLIENFNDFNVSTIDSFLMKIFSVSSQELGYNPEWELSFSYKELVDYSFERFMYEMTKRKSGFGKINTFLKIINSLEGRYLFNPVDRIKEHFKKFLEKEDIFLASASKLKFDIEKLAKLSKKIEKMSAELLRNTDRAFFYSEFLKAIDDINIESIAGKFVNDKVIQKRKLENFEKQYPDKYSVILQLKKLSENYLDFIIKFSYQPYIDLFFEFKKVFEEYKKNEGKTVNLSNIIKDVSVHLNDMSSLKIIDIYIKMSAKISHFFIDEFQDTSYLQFYLLKPLIEEALSKGGSLFVIGDIKQAIYMFRNADYRIMKDLIENRKDNLYLDTASVPKGIEVYDIHRNFRSKKNILDYVNNVFSSEKFKNYLIEKQINDVSGIAGIKHIPCDENLKGGYVETTVIDAKHYDEDVLKEKLLEIVMDVRSRFNDKNIAILTSKNEYVEEISAWLSEAGIPVVSYSSLDVRKKSVINSILSLFTFLNNPSDNLKFAEFILSDVFLKKSKIPKKDILDFIFKFKKKGLLYKNFMEIYKNEWNLFFEELFNKVGFLNIYELIILIYRNFSVFDNFIAESSFLLKFLDVAYKISVEKGINSPKEFIDIFSEDGDDNEFFSVESREFTDAVRVMTFHKSKGLDFDVVINIFKGKEDTPSSMYFHKDENKLMVYRINKDFAEINEFYRNVYSQEREKNIIQDINLFYVALTRAKYELYNIVFKSSHTNKLFKILEDTRIGSKINLKSDISDKKNTDKIFPSISSRHSYIHDFILADRVEDARRGKIYHRFLSMFDYFDNVSDKKIDEFVKKSFLLEGYSYDPALAEDIKKKFPYFKKLEIFKKKPLRRILNEVEVVSESGQLYRIDRLIIDRELITIVDYKTGGKDEKYIAQLRNYINIAKGIFDRKLKAYVYYIDLNELEEIDG